MGRVAFNSTAWLAAIVDSSDDAIVSKDLNGIVSSWNTGAVRMFGYTPDEIVGESILKIIPQDRHSEETYIQTLIRKGERINHYNTIRRCKDGRLLNVSLTVSPIRNDDREIVGISKIARDITDWKLAQETQALLLRELNHRSKNLLAVADAIVRQTAKSTAPAELVNRISRRFHALSVNQDVLIERNWHGAEISHIIRSQIATLIEDQSRVRLEGPALFVNPAAAQALGMAFYELAANALKYGSLSVPTGLVDVIWIVTGANDARELKLLWREAGGPPPAIPNRKGFGSTIIEDMVARSVLGKASVTYPATGLVWELNAPQAGLMEHAEAAVI
jgi:PAS domain S-box-containing protein